MIRDYRPDIDGLRAVAVLVVLLFHVGVRGFGGGFVGVDVFFVISGFLITGNIKADIDRGTFSFARFYLRRARRLFPALFATLALSFAAGAVWFSPEHLEKLGHSLIAAITSLSNFYFWSESGYFDLSAGVKPLLHTWSLAVEEQFYLVWPGLFLLLSATRKKWLPPAFLAAVGFLSLVATQHMLRTDPDGAFYLAPARIVELAMGALCVWIIQHGPRARAWREAFTAFGLVLIAYAVLRYSDRTVFPGVTALVPCAGAALIILGSNPPIAARVLNNPLAVGIGLISYSLYLVHWPILVFYKYTRLTAFTGVEKATVIAASLAAAAAMYCVVERPFRFGAAIVRLRPRRFALACAVPAVILSAIAADAWLSNGWLWRFPQEIRITAEDRESLRAASWGLDEANNKRRFPVKGQRNILVIGDSFSRDITNALLLNHVSANVYNRTIDTSCQPVLDRNGISSRYLDTPGNRENCDAGMAETLASTSLSGADIVIFAAHWQEWSIAKMPATLAAVKQHTHAQIVVVGPRMVFDDVPTLLTRYGRREGAETYVNGYQLDPAMRYGMNESLRKVAADAGALYIDMLAVFCPDHRCPILSDGGRVLVYDEAHLTLDGALLLGEKLRASGSPATALIFHADAAENH